MVKHKKAGQSGKKGGSIANEDLGDAPRLGDAPVRAMRRIAVEDLADAPDPGFSDVMAEGTNQLLDALPIPVYAVVRVREVPDQPRPRGPLMIDAVALLRPTFVSPGV